MTAQMTLGRRLLAIVALSSLVLPLALRAQTPEVPKPAAPALTPTQVAAIEKKLKDLEKGYTDLVLKKNGSAEQVFKAAASSPEKALELYLKCYQEINFTRLNKEDREFREWRDANLAQFEFAPFKTALQMQLHYLSLVTRAAQQEELSAIFGDLTSFMGQIQSLSEPPHPYLNSDISGSIFAEVYNLDSALRRKEDTWELNPMNISGIYDKTILPFLREHNTASLESAWTSRIQQETKMAQLFLAFENGMERYQEKSGRGNDGGGRVRNEVGRMAQFVRGEAKRAERFQEDRLPALNFGKAKDQFNYSNRAFGAKAMLDVIEANLTHDQAGDWIQEMQVLVANNGNAPAPAAGAAAATPANPGS